MAIIQNPIIGRTRNLAGGMVFSTVHGKNVMRSKPFSYNDKNSAEQHTQRARFTGIMKMMVFLKAFFDNIFLEKPSGRSMFSAAISQLFAESGNFSGVSNLLVNGLNLILGNGNIVSDGALTYEYVPASDYVTFVWNGESTPQIESTFKVNALVINMTKRDAELIEAMSDDSGLTANAPVPADWESGDAIVGFLQWQNVAGDLRSPFYGCEKA